MPWFNGKEGRWITVRGTHIFLENGKDPQEAIKERFSDAFDEAYEYDDKYESSFDRGYKLYRTWNGYQRTPNFYDQYGEIDVNLNDADVLEILNNENLSEDDIKGQLGELVAPDESISHRYQIGLEVLRDYREEYTQILREREKAKFAPRVEKADEFLKGFSRIAEKDYESSSKGANLENYGLSNRFPYNQAKYDEYTSNCQRCVMAWYLRYLGYDVEAMPYDGEIKGMWGGMFDKTKNPSNWALNRAAPKIWRKTEYGSVTQSSWAYSGFNIPKDTYWDFQGKNKQWASTQKKEISNIVSKSNDGDVFFCSVYWRGSDSGHVFVIVNDKGTAKFIDPQDNTDASVYFNPQLYGLITEKTTMLKISDKSLNGDILPEIVRKKGEAKRLYDEDQARNYKSI